MAFLLQAHHVRCLGGSGDAFDTLFVRGIFFYRPRDDRFDLGVVRTRSRIASAYGVFNYLTVGRQ